MILYILHADILSRSFENDTTLYSWVIISFVGTFSYWLSATAASKKRLRLTIFLTAPSKKTRLLAPRHPDSWEPFLGIFIGSGSLFIDLPVLAPYTFLYRLLAPRHWSSKGYLQKENKSPVQKYII